METIVLSTKKQLDIYINPQRQMLLRQMQITGCPMTPKQLSYQLGISASAVQHHIAKLRELELLTIDHTEQVRGITARYYRLLPRIVSIGAQREDVLDDQRMALLLNSLTTIFSGFQSYLKHSRNNPVLSGHLGDILTGIAHLNPGEAAELFGLIHSYLDSHESAGEGTVPWEYALIAYPVKGGDDA